MFFHPCARIYFVYVILWKTLYYSLVKIDGVLSFFNFSYVKSRDVILVIVYVMGSSSDDSFVWGDASTGSNDSDEMYVLCFNSTLSDIRNSLKIVLNECLWIRHPLRHPLCSTDTRTTRTETFYRSVYW